MNQQNSSSAESLSTLQNVHFSYPTYEHAEKARVGILSLVLPDTGMTVNDSWMTLNAYVSMLQTKPDFARENAAALAAVAQSLWQAGLEYKRTVDGLSCAYEGWLLLKNSGLGEMNFPDIEHWGEMHDYAFMTMLGDEPLRAERRAECTSSQAFGIAA